MSFPKLEAAYQAANVSGHIYARLLSQQALLRRSKAHVDQLSGTVYRPEEAHLASYDSRGLPVSTVVDLQTAFWQGATARAAAQRTVSAVGMALAADALVVNGPEGIARWGNHPLAVVMRAGLPLRIAAWPLVWWNQDLSIHVVGAGPMRGAALGSGLAEYVVGTGYRDRPDAPQVSPGYMVVAPPAFEEFKSHGLLGIPEEMLRHWAQRLVAPSARAGHAAGPAPAPGSWSQAAAQACMLGAVALRVASQALRLPLCAVWCCELALGGLVGVAHVTANHAMQLMVLGVQQFGAWMGLAEHPSRPMWQNLDAFRAEHARDMSERLAVRQIEQHLQEAEVLREIAPNIAAKTEEQGTVPAAVAASVAENAAITMRTRLPGLNHQQAFEQL